MPVMIMDNEKLMYLNYYYKNVFVEKYQFCRSVTFKVYNNETTLWEICGKFIKFYFSRSSNSIHIITIFLYYNNNNIQYSYQYFNANYMNKFWI